MPRLTGPDQPPYDRLTQLGLHMNEALQRHPGYDGERTVVLLTNLTSGRSSLQTHGYDDEEQALRDLVDCLRQAYQARGYELEVKPRELPPATPTLEPESRTLADVRHPDP